MVLLCSVGLIIESVGVYRPCNKVSKATIEAQGMQVQDDTPEYRFHANTEETTVYMGIEAVKDALKKSSLEAKDIDLTMCFSAVSDYVVPQDLPLILREVGLSNSVYWNVDVACASFIAQMGIASAVEEVGRHKNIILINVMNWINRGMSPSTNTSTMGDGASAVILKQDGQKSLVGIKEKSETDFFEFITLRSPHATGKEEYFNFDSGVRYPKFFMSRVLEPAKQLLQEHKLSGKDITWFIPHQVGTSMMHRWSKSLGFSQEACLHTFNEAGNMSAVNIPYSLHKYIYEDPKIKKGDICLFMAAGAGIQSAACLWKY